jgi:selenocysteine lyase/cysteine desulfurase
VQDAMRRYLEYTDMGPYHTMVSVLERQVESVRRQLARAAGCDPEEMAITRNASESLENAQYGIDLKPGDEVLTTNQDYPRMLSTFAQRERREGIVLKTISFPVPPPSMDDLYQRFERAITPKTKLILFCHITNRTGQIFPVRRICQMARARGIPAIVDGAHAFSHFPFKISDLDCDYYGTSLHKWTYAPIGTGFLYVRKSRVASTWSMMASGKDQAGDIRKFEEIGTHPAANHNAISEALLFNENLGIDRKAARLRYLRDRWANRVAQHPKCRILHSADPAQSCGIGFLSFAQGVDGGKMREALWNKYNILTTYMGHEEYSGLRITPNVYTTVREIDTFADMVERELAG